MVPDSGTAYGFSILSTTSGLPISQPAANVGTGGRSLGSPLGAPRSTQATSVSFSRSVNRRSFEKVPRGSVACHGGIRPVAICALIDLAHGLASSYDVSDIGAMSPA